MTLWRRRKISVTRRGIHNMIYAQAVGLPLQIVFFQGGVIALLILTLGGNEFAIGLIYMVFNLCTVFQLVAAPYVDVGYRKRILERWLQVGAIVVVFIFFLEPVARLAGNRAAFWFLVVVMGLHSIAINIGSAAWFPLLTDMVPAKIRGRFFGRMRMVFHLTSFLVTLLAGWMLGSAPDLKRFYGVLGLVIGFHLVRLFFIAKLPDLGPARTGSPEPLWSNLRRPLTDRKFLPFFIFIILLVTIFNLTQPFILPYLHLDLGFPSSHAVYATAFIALGAVFSLVWWGRLADRHGSRFVFFLTILVMTLSWLVLVIIPVHEVSPLGAFVLAAFGLTCVGAGGSGLGIAYTVRLMHETPVHHRGPYMAMLEVVTGCIVGVGPLLAGLSFEILPRNFEVMGEVFLTKRVFFFSQAVLTLIALVGLQRLRPLAEKGTRDILKSLLYTLPWRVSGQFLTLRRLGESKKNESL